MNAKKAGKAPVKRNRAGEPTAQPTNPVTSVLNTDVATDSSIIINQKQIEKNKEISDENLEVTPPIHESATRPLLISEVTCDPQIPISQEHEGQLIYDKPQEDHFKNIVPIVRKLIEHARKIKNSEIELRFGKIVDGKFVPGIDRLTTDRYINLLQTNKKIYNTDWDEIVDYFYTIKQKRNKALARTRVSYNTSDLVTEKVHCIKNKLYDIILSVSDKNDIAVKLSLSHEEPIDLSELPQITNTEYVRIQQRRSFLHGGNPNDQNWRFDFSMTWSGKTKTEAEQAQKQQDPIFEFEIEIIGKEYFEKHDDEYLSHSLLLKGLDFLGDAAQLEIVSTNL